jgi:hypothetical protein
MVKINSVCALACDRREQCIADVSATCGTDGTCSLDAAQSQIEAWELERDAQVTLSCLRACKILIGTSCRVWTNAVVTGARPATGTVSATTERCVSCARSLVWLILNLATLFSARVILATLARSARL